MNRFDEIKAVARNIASNVHTDPAKRDAMADDLIRLCGLMVEAVGKGAAVAGESALNDAHDMVFETDPEDTPESEAERRSEFDAEQVEEQTKAHGMYLTGERIMSEAKNTVDECVAADLERYDPPVWIHVDRRPAMFRHADENGVAFVPQSLLQLGNADPADVADFATAALDEIDWSAARPVVLDTVDVRCTECDRLAGSGHDVTCSRSIVRWGASQPSQPMPGERCTECDRSLQYGHMSGCSRRSL